MAGASDKARFYLEQSIPELQEYRRKKLFSKEEIAAIIKKRSDFEHKLNARGSQPADYARYAEYEINLEALRKRRVKRLGIKANQHAGPRRILFILDRATRKFQGDLGLWMQSLEYARKEKASKRFLQILTSALRLHPTKAELWVFAARQALDEDADMASARSYMQRGLRFCDASRLLWLEYAKLEMIFLAKIAARREILGLTDDSTREIAHEDGSARDEADVIALPQMTAEDLDPNLAGDDPAKALVLQQITTSPALAGAIPRAIYDKAIQRFPSDESLRARFFHLFAEFSSLSCLGSLLDHVIETMMESSPNSPSTLSCFVRRPVTGLDATSQDFPSALGQCLERLPLSFERSRDPQEMGLQLVQWLLELLQIDGLDTAVRQVVSAMLVRTVRAAATSLDGQLSPDETTVSHWTARLVEAKRPDEARDLWAQFKTHEAPRVDRPSRLLESAR